MSLKHKLLWHAIIKARDNYQISFFLATENILADAL